MNRALPENPGSAAATAHPDRSAEALRVERVRFDYQAFSLRDVSLEIWKGGWLSIVGPNGSGKSTLLRLVSGELKPASGAVRFNGQDVHRWPLRARARSIAMVLQESSLNFPIRVVDYVLHARHPFLDRFRFPGPQDLNAVERSLELAQCAAYRFRWMNELSGGERQRVILARALAQEPKLLLLDEPTLNLDVSFQMSLLEVVKKISEKETMTVLVVTHELNLASEFSDRVLLLERGHVAAFGSVAEVFQESTLSKLFQRTVRVDCNPVSGRPRATLARDASLPEARL